MVTALVPWPSAKMIAKTYVSGVSALDSFSKTPINESHDVFILSQSFNREIKP